MNWRYFISDQTNVYNNIATEKAFFDTCEEGLLMLWVNDSCAIIGRNQNIYSEINLPFAETNSIAVARRFSGGGAVYHDAGNLNYTFITPREKHDVTAQTSVIAETLSSAGITAQLNGRNDIVTDNGRKISGNAYLSNGKNKLHHGTLMVNVDIDMLTGCLNADEDKLASKGVRSVRSRVCNISETLPLTVAALKQMILDTARARFGDISPVLPSPEQLKLRNSYASLLSSHSWIYNKMDFSRQNKKRFSWGSVEIICRSDTAPFSFSLYSDALDADKISFLQSEFFSISHNDLTAFSARNDEAGDIARFALSLVSHESEN